jgi:hypothetical protein
VHTKRAEGDDLLYVESIVVAQEHSSSCGEEHSAPSTVTPYGVFRWSVTA